MSTPTSIKVDVLLNAAGQIAGASKHSSSTDSRGEAVISGMLPTPGQQMVTIEVASSVAEMDAVSFLAHLAEHSSVRAAPSHLATFSAASGPEPVSGSL